MKKQATKSGGARPRPPDDVFFPVVPMLDMAFQLLAFFILTFQAPSNESVLNLRMPIGPAALPELGRSGVPLARPSADSAVSLVLKAEAGPDGELGRLSLGGEEIRLIESVPELLRQSSLGGTRPIRLTLEADDALRYKFVALLLTVTRQAYLESLRLAEPASEKDDSF